MLCAPKGDLREGGGSVDEKDGDGVLRGTAQLWYNSGPDEMQKDGLRHRSDSGTLTAALQRQFKRPLGDFLRQRTEIRYTLLDAADRRPLAQYVLEV